MIPWYTTGSCSHWSDYRFTHGAKLAFYTVGSLILLYFLGKKEAEKP